MVALVANRVPAAGLSKRTVHERRELPEQAYVHAAVGEAACVRELERIRDLLAGRGVVQRQVYGAAGIVHAVRGPVRLPDGVEGPVEPHGVVVPEIPKIDLRDPDTKQKKWSCRCVPPINARVAVENFRARCLNCGHLFEKQER